MTLSKRLINKKLRKRIFFILGHDIEIIKTNNIEIELCEYYLSKELWKYNPRVSNKSTVILHRIKELNDDIIVYCRIQRCGIRFNYTPNLIDIIKAIILKYYCRFFIFKKK